MEQSDRPDCMCTEILNKFKGASWKERYGYEAKSRHTCMCSMSLNMAMFKVISRKPGCMCTEILNTNQRCKLEGEKTDTISVRHSSKLYGTNYPHHIRVYYFEPTHIPSHRYFALLNTFTAHKMSPFY